MEHLIKSASTKLNKQQLEMLRLFDKPLPDSDYLAVKKQIVQILAKQLDDEMERLEEQNNWNETTYET